MNERKLTWLKLWANPEKGGTGNHFFALASSRHWDGKYQDITSAQTRAWSIHLSGEGGCKYEHLDAPIWSVEVIDQSTVPTNLQIALLTTAAESGGF